MRLGLIVVRICQVFFVLLTLFGSLGFSSVAFAAGTPAAPEYVGGADGGGLTNSGSASLGVASDGSRTVVVQGNYAFVVSAASSTDCSQTASESNGCELKVFDISDPVNPTFVGGADASGSTNSGTGSQSGNGIAISGNYVYTLWGYDINTCSQTPGSAMGCELKVFDISNPAEPAYVGGGDASGTTNSTGATFGGSSSGISITISDNYAYTIWGSNGNSCSQTTGVGAKACELKVWNISNPSAPAYVGGADASGSTNSGTGSRNGRSVFVLDDYVYTVWDGDSTPCSQTPGSAIGCEFKIFDISDPSAPAYVGGADASGSTNSGAGNLIAYSVALSGNYAYTLWSGNFTTCSQTPGLAIGCELKVWDVSDPAEPIYVSGSDANGSTNSGAGSIVAHDIFILNSYAYTIWRDGSVGCASFVASGCELKVWNISDPANPTYLGGGDADGRTNAGSGSRNGRSVFVLDDYVYTVWDGDSTPCSQTPGSAIGCELKVWHIGDTEAPTVSLTAPADSVTLSASSSVVISATATDNIGVAGVSFYVNGTQIGSEDTSAPYSVTWDSTATNSGEKTIIAVARDEANNYATSSARTVTVANEPGFSNVTATPGATSATITWTTTAAASSRVFFGVVDSLASSTPEINTGGSVTTSHSVTISNLPSCTSFKYLAVSTNSGADTATSSERTFATTGCTGSASIATSTSNIVTTAAGGTLTHDSLTLTVPTSFTSTSSAAVFQANQLDGTSFFASAGTPSGKSVVGNKAFALVALVDGTAVLANFSSALTISMTYDASDVEDLDESSLAIYRYDGASWSPLSGCAVNTGTRTVTCQTTRFSDFALFGDPETAASGPTYSTRVKRPEPAKNDTPAPIARTPYTPLPVYTRDLTLGAAGDDVRTLQLFLMAANSGVRASALAQVGATGYFGALTEAALAEYQAAQGISPAVGYFGPLTRQHVANTQPTTAPTTSLAQPGTLFTRTLTLGVTGTDVRHLQQFLNQNGYPLTATGAGAPDNETDYYGALTAAALGRFQVATGIVAGATTPGYGVFGPVTRARVGELLRTN